MLMVDIDKAERLLLNFVDNALKYSPMDTVVTISITPPALQMRDGLRPYRIIDQGPVSP